MEQNAAHPEDYRDYLRLIARQQFPPTLRRVVDSSDLVQDTLVKACAHWESIRLSGEGERRNYLRKILSNGLIDLLRRQQYQTDIHMLSAALDSSSARIDSLLVSNETMPFDNVVQQEKQLRFAWALRQLPENQQLVIERHLLNDMSLRDTAREMGITEAAAAGLVRRGRKRLADLLSVDRE